jgi:hypothetical protein
MESPESQYELGSDMNIVLQLTLRMPMPCAELTNPNDREQKKVQQSQQLRT